MFGEITDGIFASWVRFPIVLKFFIMFINEGIKVKNILNTFIHLDLL